MLAAAKKNKKGRLDQQTKKVLCAQEVSWHWFLFSGQKISKRIFCALSDLRSSSCAKSPRQPTSRLLEVEAVGEKKKKKKPWKVENDHWWPQAHRPWHNLTEVQNFVAASVIPASGPSARDLRFDRSKISLLLLSLSSSADPSLPCQDLNLNP